MKFSGRALCAAVAFLAFTPLAQSQTLLSGEEAIKKQLAGKTIQFLSRTKTTVSIYFAENGQFKSHWDGIKGTGKWWVDGGEMFCREFVKGPPLECSRVEVEGAVVTFHVAGRGPYKAKVVPGDKVP